MLTMWNVTTHVHKCVCVHVWVRACVRVYENSMLKPNHVARDNLPNVDKI